MTSGPDIALEKVLFDYGSAPMLFDVTLSGGITTAIIGPSGSGKSTILNLIAGFEIPDSGRILVGGKDVTSLSPAERPVTMVFQDNNLFAHLTVRRNVSIGLDRKTHRGASESIVDDALERVGLAGYGDRKPGMLSGGERQRVALARVLVRQRPVLLLDEPFAALGPGLRSDMLALIRDLQQETGMTVAVVTHQPDEAEQFADEFVFVDQRSIAGQGSAAGFSGRRDIPGLQAYMGEKDR